MALININSVRSIEWARNYNWSVMIEMEEGKGGVPVPFDKWFPAVDVETELGVITPYDVEYYMTTLSVPQKGGERSLSITYYDNEDLVLHRWLEEWVMETTLNEKKYITPLNGKDSSGRPVVRTVHLKQLKSDMDTVIRELVFKVWPDGPVSIQHSSEQGLLLGTISFKVVGTKVVESK